MLRAGIIGFVAIKRHMYKYLQKLLNVVGRGKVLIGMAISQ
jgi:hypothetical protein